VQIDDREAREQRQQAGQIEQDAGAQASAIRLSYMPRLISMPSAIAKNVGAMSLARNIERSIMRFRRALAADPRNMWSPTAEICGHSVAHHRLAWRAVQWRAWFSEARRTGRGLVVSRPCVEPLKRRDECREYCDNHRNSDKSDGGTVAIPLVTHQGPPL
jgi:hypothetical protein